MTELEAVKDSKAKYLLLVNLKKLCEKYEIDTHEIDDHLSYGENKQHILNLVGKSDHGEAGSRDIEQYAHAIEMEQARQWLVNRSQDPRVRNNIVHARRRDFPYIIARLKARGFPSVRKRFYLSVVGEPELVHKAIDDLWDSGYPIRYAHTTRNHKPFAFPLCA